MSAAALRGFPHASVRCRKWRDHLVHAALAGEYAKNGIRANLIYLGLVKTDRVLQCFGNPDDPNSGSPQA